MSARQGRTAPRWRQAELTLDDRIARGRDARGQAPRSGHARWEPAPGRPDPVKLLQGQAATRVPELVPIRYGRMLVSPCTFYRGAAADHGVRPGRDAPQWGHRATLRGRPPVELRRVRLPGAAADLRHQRLRRDAARSVGVGRQAAGGQLRDRRPRPRGSPRTTGATSCWPGCASTGSSCARRPGCGPSTRGTPTWTRRPSRKALPRRSAVSRPGQEGSPRGPAGHREGANPRQRAGAGPAGREGGRRAPDRP